ncbi:S8 family peptidase [Fluviicola taffensis]|uniref:Peptidase S8 and S53 subtilisin kexin sedolisin n=1 Tax=Fluviicola taffensis (strain DSM 16823 / NCIMB 13979 / RW262) TaxID=755732 RepID=F2ID68_FLUTR|nr:S8 family peptidase [Fluviicola taffensis]AEA45483.1 peptidase S8 and S53 subtilisin kexin sedolisin [Fluviicola taffensis DSM 16823]
MKKRILTLSLALFSVGVMNFIYGQKTDEIKNWYNGATPGMNTEKAYSSLKKQQSTTVIVAVIDSGIDIEHKDLQGKIWTNEKEIPNNGIDDDKNGYIDDIHGWNFLGAPNGDNQDYTRLEKTRICAELHQKFNGKSESEIAAADKADYATYKELYKAIETERNGNIQALEQYTQLGEMFPMLKAKLIEKLGPNFTEDDVNAWKVTTPEDMQLKQLGTYIANGQLSEESIKEGVDHFNGSINYQLNMEYNDRQFIGDNPDDFNDIHYGNNDVEGPEALHGTHVGGIIGAVRHNELGGDGVAENVKLMSLRAVPNGDEQDKDIALAIRYAADNGASVINMSFGKAYSKHPKEVYEAMLYAESKGVLLVHAAGNDGENLDEHPNFPTNEYSFQTKPLDMYICIGASTRDKKKLAANFSNYSSRQVNIFAPGFEIYNTIPQSDYKILQGTSMAAPMVSGVAALLKSYFPSLTMKEIKDIMLASAKQYKGTMIPSPGTDTPVDFGKLSTTGGVIDIAAAVKMCKAKVKK